MILKLKQELKLYESLKNHKKALQPAQIKPWTIETLKQYSMKHGKYFSAVKGTMHQT